MIIELITSSTLRKRLGAAAERFVQRLSPLSVSRLPLDVL